MIHQTPLDYTLRTMLPMNKWARDIDNHTRQVIRKAFHLPKTTCTPTLHYAWKSGSLGWASCAELMTSTLCGCPKHLSS